MKFTLPWLKEHLDTDEPLNAIVDKLTMIGLEVERVEDKAALLKPFVIANVISAEKHPNADRLRVCMVDIGDGQPIQVVCGAPNARAGMKGVFSAPGTFIPGKNITLTVGTIRGVESRGMLCSAAELMISDDHDGIIELPADAPVGKSYVEWAGVSEPVIDINLTPNRPDCTGVNGIARDLGATSHRRLQGPPAQAGEGHVPLPGQGHARFRCDGFALPGVRPAAGERRQERSLAGMAAKAAHRDRPASDQRAGRHHQLHHLRPRPPAACVRRRQGARQSHRAARPQRRDAARARRQNLHARPGHLRDRRRKGRRIARRHHGRRGHRLLGDNHRRADRIGAVGRVQHRADRPQARHQFRRALSLRARRRSEFHAAGPRARHADGARSVRRRSRPRSWWPAIRRRRKRSSIFP